VDIQKLRPGQTAQFKSLFNVSFLLIITLTCALLVMQGLLRAHALVASPLTDISILLGAVFFLLINHLMFLNNRWLKRINARMNLLSRHNPNTWSVVILINVIIICAFLLFTVA